MICTQNKLSLNHESQHFLKDLSACLLLRHYDCSVINMKCLKKKHTPDGPLETYYETHDQIKLKLSRLHFLVLTIT